MSLLCNFKTHPPFLSAGACCLLIMILPPVQHRPLWVRKPQQQTKRVSQSHCEHVCFFLCFFCSCTTHWFWENHHHPSVSIRSQMKHDLQVRRSPSAVVFLVHQCFASQHVEIYWTSDFYTVINFYGQPLLSGHWTLCTLSNKNKE